MSYKKLIDYLSSKNNKYFNSNNATWKLSFNEKEKVQVLSSIKQRDGGRAGGYLQVSLNKIEHNSKENSTHSNELKFDAMVHYLKTIKAEKAKNKDSWYIHNTLVLDGFKNSSSPDKCCGNVCFNFACGDDNLIKFRINTDFFNTKSLINLMTAINNNDNLQILAIFKSTLLKYKSIINTKFEVRIDLDHINIEKLIAILDHLEKRDLDLAFPLIENTIESYLRKNSLV